jgi:beta-phosphoglucomutase
MRKVVLFDMDGVLYDSMPNHAIAWVRAMESFGVKFTADDAYITEGARGVDTVRKYLKEQTGKVITEEEALRMYNVKAERFAELPTARIMPGALQLMEKIQKDGLKIGVVTGSAQRPLINRILNDFSSFVTEDHIVTAFDVKHGKPDPEPYLTGMQKCGGYSPSETIVVENAPFGVKAGHASGAYTIAVNTGPLPDSALVSQGSDRLFPSMQALADSWEQLIAEIN